ncbi:hypothetical protein AAVH_05009 [Aphelenchoides avenae]|nr:hypothetical protein AAVH_05009 [Aphelenchus avenae]
MVPILRQRGTSPNPSRLFALISVLAVLISFSHFAFADGELPTTTHAPAETTTTIPETTTTHGHTAEPIKTTTTEKTTTTTEESTTTTSSKSHDSTTTSPANELTSSHSPTNLTTATHNGTAHNGTTDAAGCVHIGIVTVVMQLLLTALLA